MPLDPEQCSWSLPAHDIHKGVSLLSLGHCSRSESHSSLAVVAQHNKGRTHYFPGLGEPDGTTG